MSTFFKILNVLFFVGTCMSAEIGDFSPLQVGNTWLYQGFYSGWVDWEFLPNRKSLKMERFRSIKVLSMVQEMDTLKYSIEVVDSNFNRTINGIKVNDTVTTVDFILRERLGKILPQEDMRSFSDMYQDAFYAHQYADTLTKNQLIENTNRLVVEESVWIGLHVYMTKKLARIKDIGIHTSTYTVSGYTYNPETTSYSLIKFNNLEIHPVGIRQKLIGKTRSVVQSRNTSWILGTKSVNCLGRHTKHLGADLLKRRFIKDL
jgi:hypothetical protein